MKAILTKKIISCIAISGVLRNNNLKTIFIFYFYENNNKARYINL
ncbi:hypothetical protein K034_2307 [Acinetobacter baumannii 42057_3]|nr:hypothetical protein K034_2307 [Acinetobacter baumannii 42057_3]